jgi:hypothetical protein
MTASAYEHTKTHWKEQTWRVGHMLHVGLTDSHVHEGLLNGVVVGHIVMFWHQRQNAPSEIRVAHALKARKR